ncbi:MAG: IS1595 family transposase [Roseiarcus sp.]|jgi:transposase-like protein|uniref:IS1595 family transposase n=1 Tax=Roseiarcus sp. TaxID=1969460 RepID=UPI003C1BAA9E
MSSVISDRHFHDERAAYAYVEARIWPNGPSCPHCGNADGARIRLMAGKSTRIGVRQCNECRKPFTVKVGTIFESSHVPLRLWLQAIHLVCSSKKGVSANQLHRILGVTLKTAWFMGHRIREAMRDGGLSPLGGGGGTVEIDETYIGRVEGVPKPRGGSSHKNVVLTLVEREGSARSFHIDRVSIADMAPIIHANIARETKIMTDQGAAYPVLCEPFASHDTVNHAKDEYVRREGDKVVTTNTVEGYYSIFKRGMKGIYQHCAEKHLHRYLAEFDFRYSNRARLGVNDIARADRALRGAVGKRLTYQTTAN